MRIRPRAFRVSMARYDIVVIGAGLGGLTAGAILARAGRKVLVIERSNSVGGAASSYKSGDLFVEGSLHQTSDPHDPRDPKHRALTRAGVIDAVKWIPVGAFYEARGVPLDQPFLLPDNFDAARRALTERFPEARAGIDQLLEEMERIASAVGTLSQGSGAFRKPREALGALLKLLSAVPDWRLSLSQKLTRLFGDNEAVKCALAANLSYYHDDPATLWWVFFAIAQGSFLLSGGRYVQGDSSTVTHTARDRTDAQVVECVRIVGNAAPAALAPLMPAADAEKLNENDRRHVPSISLFALTLGLSKPPREFGFSAYSTQLLPPEMARLSDYAQGTALMAEEPGKRMPPMSIVDYAAIDSGVPAPPYALLICGPDQLSNWDSSDMDAYREKRGRWQQAIVGYLSSFYPGLEDAVVASSFNTALSVRQYLNAPDGAVYGFAPTPPRSIWRVPVRSPRTAVPGLYLASAYAGFGGYSGVVQSAGACADMILREDRKNSISVETEAQRFRSDE